MIVHSTDKIVAAVRLETCLQDENGDASEYGLERAKELAETRFLVIVSPKAQTALGLREVYRFLGNHSVPYGDVWASPGIPDAAEWYDALTEPW